MVPSAKPWASEPGMAYRPEYWAMSAAQFMLVVLNHPGSAIRFTAGSSQHTLLVKVLQGFYNLTFCRWLPVVVKIEVETCIKVFFDMFRNRKLGTVFRRLLCLPFRSLTDSTRAAVRPSAFTANRMPSHWHGSGHGHPGSPIETTDYEQGHQQLFGERPQQKTEPPAPSRRRRGCRSTITPAGNLSRVFVFTTGARSPVSTLVCAHSGQTERAREIVKGLTEFRTQLAHQEQPLIDAGTSCPSHGLCAVFSLVRRRRF